MKKILLALTAATTLVSAPAFARHHYDRHHHTQVVRVYDTRGRYVHPHRLSRNDHIWRDRDGRVYCRRDNGTTGLVIGAGAGALLGNELARGSGDRTLATIIGAVGGGVIGQSVDKGNIECQ